MTFAVAVLSLGLLFAGSVSASTLPKTSWQVYYPAQNKLVVHVNDNPTSDICWQGDAFVFDEDGVKTSGYNGHCTAPLN